MPVHSELREKASAHQDGFIGIDWSTMTADSMHWGADTQCRGPSSLQGSDELPAHALRGQ